ncbi:MAG: hypothetical protein QOG61_474 [Candidatus Binataceae bacterium]|jgi:hypothetical protein|nr:hypothetical protein [Candidatus Binataceae bacterium]
MQTATPEILLARELLTRLERGFLSPSPQITGSAVWALSFAGRQ